MQNLKQLMTDRKPEYSPFKAENNRSVTNDAIFAYAHEKINILLFVLIIFAFFFYDFNWNTQDFLCLEFVKYQLGLHRNVLVFAKCNVNISVTQLFYLQTCPGLLPISK